MLGKVSNISHTFLLKSVNNNGKSRWKCVMEQSALVSLVSQQPQKMDTPTSHANPQVTVPPVQTSTPGHRLLLV